MKKQGKKRQGKLPGKGWLIISFIPYINWTALVYIGILNAKLFYILFGLLYGVLTYHYQAFPVLLWIVGILHYAAACASIKKQNGKTVKHKKSGKTVPREKRSYEDVYKGAKMTGGKGTPVRQPDIQKGGLAGTFVNNPREKFFNDMERFCSREEKEVSFVPFMSYMPTYDSMDGRQQAWYFFWRSQVRQGNYADTDLSYLFIYIYELLSGIGWSIPQEGGERLSAVWMEYRGRFPKLDHYMPGWIFDFAQLHRLEYNLHLDQVPMRLTPSVMTDSLIDSYAGGVPLKLPFSLIDALTDYPIENSKFYKDGNAELIQEAIPRVIALADAFLRKEKQKGLLAAYGPDETKKQERYLFSSAVCPLANKKITIEVRGYSTDERLRAYLNELVRFGENMLRALKGYRGRLRGITLEEVLAGKIEAFLRKEYGQAAGQEQGAEREGISRKELLLDFDSIEELREQSDAVRSALEVEEAGEAEEKPLLTDVEEVTALYLALSPAARSFLDRLQKGEWEERRLPEDEEPAREVNRLAERYLGCMLIVNEGDIILAEDDYRDELDYVYENPPQAGGREDNSRLFNISCLPAGLQELMEALLPEQEEALYAIMTGDNPQSSLERIAEERMTMPEILVDGVNEAAMRTLGDILIDSMGRGPVVTDEYSDMLSKSIIQKAAIE